MERESQRENLVEENYGSIVGNDKNDVFSQLIRIVTVRALRSEHNCSKFDKSRDYINRIFTITLFPHA